MYKYLISTIVLLHYGFALLLPFWGTPVLIGTSFEKLERDPVIASTCTGFVLVSIVLRYILETKGIGPQKRGLPFISLIALLLAAFTVYRGHIYSAVLILASTSLLFRQTVNERLPSQR